VSDLILKLLIALVVLGFAAACLFITRPASAAGKFSLKLALINGAGWLLLLPLPNDGHPPLWLVALAVFWLINLVLLPAATIALWMSFKEREEKTRYVAAAGSYLGLNFVVLFLVPLIWLAFN
jgi:CDP-diglyceride synthetase